jgi:hypothetical protein
MPTRRSRWRWRRACRYWWRADADESARLRRDGQPCLTGLVERFHGIDALGLVQVGGTDRSDEVGIAVAVNGYRSPAPELAPQHLEELLERLGGLARGRHGNVPPLQSGPLVGREVVPSGHRGHHQPDAVALEPLDLRLSAFGTVAPASAARPLEGAQLARARPPDSLRCLHLIR